MNYETKYEDIGNNYNSTRVADEYLTNRIFNFLKPISKGINLDIGCGTGNYTIALAEKGLNFIGVEPSMKMLDIAKSKSNKIEWKIGYAEKIPVENETFENVIATLTIHHWTNLNIAIKEIFRVLKPNGKLVIFTSCPTQMENYWLNHYFPVMMQHSILQMPNIHEVAKELTKESFSIINIEKYFVNNQLKDFFLFSGKERPEIYFNEKIRNGISSFAALSNKMEVEIGLEKLKIDLESGEFDKIKQNYNEDEGDYVFLVAKKEG